MARPPQPRVARPPLPVDGAAWIPLTRGKFALVDAQDAALVGLFHWNCQQGKSGPFYAKTMLSGRHTLWMHRLIVPVGKGFEIDHINGDGLDNRRANLRVVTRAQNLGNTGLWRHNTSGYKGVSRAPRLATRPWRAQISVGNKSVPLGTFWTAEEAAAAYDVVARAHFGEAARTNFSSQWGG